MLREVARRTTGFGLAVAGIIIALIVYTICLTITAPKEGSDEPVFKETEHGTVLCNRKHSEWACEPIQ